MPLRAFGFNGFGQTSPFSPSNPKGPLGHERRTQVAAASWSQTVLMDEQQRHFLLGYDPDSDSTVSGKHLEDVGKGGICSWLGKQHFVACVDTDGSVFELSGQKRCTPAIYADGVMSGNGQVLLARRQAPPLSHPAEGVLSAVSGNGAGPSLRALSKEITLELWSSLEALLSHAAENGHSDRREFRLSPLDTLVDMFAGAGHFVVHVSRPVQHASQSYHDMLYSFGDNRFGQLGLKDKRHSPFVAEPCTIDCFNYWKDPPRQIACGDNHTAIICASGSAVMFGSDREGQCGGHGQDGSPERVESFAQEGIKAQAIACGSNHTVVVTDGRCYATGANQHGQCGVHGVPQLEEFTRLPSILLSQVEPVQLACGRWHTILGVSEGDRRSQPDGNDV